MATDTDVVPPTCDELYDGHGFARVRHTADDSWRHGAYITDVFQRESDGTFWSADYRLITVPARHAAIAWLNACLARSKDKERPLLQCVSLEVFDRRGVQLIATNGHVLFRTWAAVRNMHPSPEFDEAPDRQLTVMDPDGFGVGFMTALLRVTSEEAHQDEALTITSSPVDEEAAPSFGVEYQTERVTLRACGQRLDLLVRQEPYPAWRKLNLGLNDLALVDGMKVQPKYLGLIGKLKDVSSVDMTFAGTDRAIYLVASGEEGYGVQGLLMPMRRLTTEQTSAKGAQDDDDSEDDDDAQAREIERTAKRTPGRAD
jgi:hypothetical protein